MHSIEYNLTLFNEMMEEFEVFILSQELFWPLQRKSYGNVPFPQLSLGALLITLDELSVQHSAMDAHQDRSYQALLDEYERFSPRRQVAIEHKAARELTTRTTLWGAYLQDLDDDPDLVVDYAREVRNRVLMSKLSTLASPTHAEDEMEDFRELDQRVMLDAVSVNFLWDEKLEPIYPLEDFPFLYVQPRQIFNQ